MLTERQARQFFDRATHRWSLPSNITKMGQDYAAEAYVIQNAGRRNHMNIRISPTFITTYLFLYGTYAADTRRTIYYAAHRDGVEVIASERGGTISGYYLSLVDKTTSLYTMNEDLFRLICLG